jgi:perosamine synthetase
MSMLRYQLPVHSPVTLDALAKTARAVARSIDARPELEALLRRTYNANSVTLCGSGTDALTRALRLARKSERNPHVVGLPAFSCYDLATAAVGADADIMLYDLDPNTLGPDIDSLRRIIAAGAQTVVIAPLYGMPVEWEPIENLARSAGVTLIEDAAQGHAARYRGQALGTFADLSVLSFGRGKGWTAGRGGALLQRRESRVASGLVPSAGGDASVLVSSTAHWLCGRPWSYGIPASIPWLALGETIYRDPTPPSQMTRAAAALALATYADAQRAIGARTTMAQFFDAALPTNDQLGMIHPVAGAVPGYLRYPLRIRGGVGVLGSARDVRPLGIMPAYPSTLAKLEAVRARLRGPAIRCTGAAELARDLITLPTHALVTQVDADRIVALIADTCADSLNALQLMGAAGRAEGSQSNRSLHVVS